MQTRPTELQSITSRVGDGSGHGNDDDAAMDVLGAWEICGEGEREGVGGWDRGVGAWRPYPLPASAWQRGEGRPVRRERTGAPRSAVQGKEATDGVRWAGWVGVGRGPEGGGGRRQGGCWTRLLGWAAGPRGGCGPRGPCTGATLEVPSSSRAPHGKEAMAVATKTGSAGEVRGKAWRGPGGSG